jgi:hypothetical protein
MTATQYPLHPTIELEIARGVYRATRTPLARMKVRQLEAHLDVTEKPTAATKLITGGSLHRPHRRRGVKLAKLHG